ncbi:MAG: hypothetical protein A2Y82_05315 [Candidatus Buchananbacteria bacterium RBG_13_36_9]|uniref:Uncharacterized protein n=1 Tax=Candidatus Buchananbacteria bacterium RBG_13_36_9 TaxID=1797530 RepID=A0A1G1XKZ4_9BACT|nr:MAG: hypothetical protein A2Y82_05315 [Candidatus Buchananbacteria bacterium RBG_13_36_9]
MTENTTSKPTVSIEIGYYDKSAFRTNSLDDLLNDENTSGKEIEFVSILGESNDGKSIKLIFGAKNNYTQLKIEGPDRQWVYVTKSTLEDRLKNFKKSIPRTGTLIFYLSIVILLLDIIIVPKIQNILPPITYPTATASNNPGLGLLIVMLADLILFTVLSILIGYIFPNVSFLIGRGIARFENRIKLRSNLFLGSTSNKHIIYYTSHFIKISKNLTTLKASIMPLTQQAIDELKQIHKKELAQIIKSL